MRLLLLYPNTANWASISTAVPILNKIAKNSGWIVEYFDTYDYEKMTDSNSQKEQAAGFRPGYSLFKVNKHSSMILSDLQDKICKFMPDLIAITGLSCDYEFLLTFFQGLKMPNENIRIVIGGIHAILAGEEIIETKLFDLVVRGEAESVFPDILKRMEARESLGGIDGTLFYDRKMKRIIKYPQRKLLPPDELWKTGADYSILGDAYFIRPFDGKMIRRMDVEVGRGCPYSCAYCGNSALKKFYKGLGIYVKPRPIVSSIEQMKDLKERRGIETFQFTDECFLAHPDSWLTEFFGKYKAEIGLPFIFQTRPETISEKKIDLLLSFQIPFQVSVGVESGSQHILNTLCERECTNEQIVRAFEILNQRHIRTNAFFMIGLPCETREDVFKTIELCRTIKPSVASVAIFQPLPGQKIREFCIKKGFITGKEPLATFTSHSLLKMPKPYLSAIEIRDLWRVFMLYSTLPREYYKDIEKCEKNFEDNIDLFNSLVKLRWEKFDHAKEKKEIQLCS